MGGGKILNQMTITMMERANASRNRLVSMVFYLRGSYPPGWKGLQRISRVKLTPPNSSTNGVSGPRAWMS